LITNSLSADRIFTTQLDALSANITVLDIKQYELSGFSVQGDCTIQGSVSASGTITADNMILSGNQVATVVDPVRTTLTGNGVLSAFAINGAVGLVNPSALIVAIDGILQEPEANYSVSGGSITFTSPIPNGSKAVVISPTNVLQVSQNIPADGSVTSEKLDTDIEIIGQLTAPNQIADKDESVMTRLIAESYNLQLPFWNVSIISGFRASTSAGSFLANGSYGQLTLAATCVTGDWLSLLFGNSSVAGPFTAQGAGNTPRFEHSFTFLLEADSNAFSGSSSEHWFLFGFGRQSDSGLPDGTLPDSASNCLAVRVIAATVTAYIHIGGNIYESTTVLMKEGATLSDKEKYCIVWDGQSLFVYANIWQPNSGENEGPFTLMTSVKAPTPLTGTMGSRYWQAQLRALVDGTNSNIHYGGMMLKRRAVHPVLPIPISSDPI
jgi:hypothetical protein